MKKTFKIVLTTIMAFMLIFTFAQPVVFAADTNPDTIVDSIKQKKDSANTNSDSVVTIAGTVINWIWIISIAVAVVVLMYTGLKFIVASTQEKAEYKKSLIPIVIGIAILVFATTIVKALFSLGGSVN